MPPTTQPFTLSSLRARVDAAPCEVWPRWISLLRADGRAGAEKLADTLERRRARAAAQAARREDLWQHEKAWLGRGASWVAGVDEAGRGPLAGPIVAAAVVWADAPELPELDDSKLLSAEQREGLLGHILQSAADWGIGVVDARTIDHIKIQRANYLAMRLALADLRRAPEAVLVDGFRLPDMPIPAERVVKGDQRSWSIAAASVLAKVTRDHLMTNYDRQYPVYGFAAHKGYGTAQHLEALAAHGPCPIHRRSFAPVAAVGGAV